MNTKDLLDQLNQKRNHLNSMQRFRDNAIQWKADLLHFVSDSGQRLDESLRQAPQNPDEISQLRERLDKDRQLYAKCEADLEEYQADIEVTKIEIRDLKWRLSTSLNKKIDDGFYKKRKDDFDKENNQNSGTASHYSNISSFPSMR
jgi:DNA repair ATPase RecN